MSLKYIQGLLKLDYLIQTINERYIVFWFQVSDWLYEDGISAETDVFELKLGELKSLTSEWFSRVREHRERPDALAALRHMLNASQNFLLQAKNLTGDDQMFTPVELETLETKITDTKVRYLVLNKYYEYKIASLVFVKSLKNVQWTWKISVKSPWSGTGWFGEITL